jgi:hypothetical protein
MAATVVLRAQRMGLTALLAPLGVLPHLAH